MQSRFMKEGKCIVFLACFFLWSSAVLLYQGDRICAT
jgi:hypothetical protein